MSQQDDEGEELSSDDLHSAISTEVVQTVPQPERREDLKDWDFEELRGRWVEVNASGYRYRGRLQGADETDLYLRTVTRYLVLPLDTVGDVKPLPEPPEPKMKRKGPIPGDPDPSMEGPPVYPESGEVLEDDEDDDDGEDTGEGEDAGEGEHAAKDEAT